MDLTALAREFNISVTKMRRLSKAGYLRGVTDDNNSVAQMKRYLMNKRRLSTAMLLELLRDQSLFLEFGNVRSKAEDQIRELDPQTLEASAMPADKWGDIIGAAINDPDCLNSIADWLLQAIPSSGCNYHYVAVRMLWNVPSERVAQVYSRIPRCLINVRAMPRLAGCSEVVQGQTKFSQPEAKNFDL